MQIIANSYTYSLYMVFNLFRYLTYYRGMYKSKCSFMFIRRRFALWKSYDFFNIKIKINHKYFVVLNWDNQQLSFICIYLGLHPVNNSRLNFYILQVLWILYISLQAFIILWLENVKSIVIILVGNLTLCWKGLDFDL